TRRSSDLSSLPHRRPAGIQARPDIALAGLVTRDQPEFNNIVLQGFIDPVCHGGFSFGGRFHFWSLPSIWGCPLFWVFGAGPPQHPSRLPRPARGDSRNHSGAIAIQAASTNGTDLPS